MLLLVTKLQLESLVFRTFVLASVVNSLNAWHVVRPSLPNNITSFHFDISLSSNIREQIDKTNTFAPYNAATSSYEKYELTLHLHLIIDSVLLH